ncbi:GntR family transcriptional regulator [Desulfobacula sp.]|uniref:GntR family transcriptional regulator n=1 Tax=Desulfobacula sp. TaxID=2593537 RepID=UPI00261403AF|nr:GntR family transcriptional regulator [Desulfobacula sp.]
MPLPVKNNQIHRPSMRDEVYNKLLTWIMEGVLRPGEKLLDKELAEHMGVSRTPVREALRRLEDKDLVESSANRWTRVSEISSREPEMIYPIIWTLDGLAAALALKTLVAKDFEKMEQANAVLKSALENNDPVAASKADAAFHDVYIERSQNNHLIKILQDLKVRYRRFEVFYFEGTAHAKNSLEDHKTIIATLKAGNSDLAIKTIHSNWQNSLERLKAGTRKQK